VPDFHDRRRALREGRDALESARTRLLAAQAGERRARTEEAALRRRLDPSDRAAARSIAAAVDELERAAEARQTAERELATTTAAALAATDAFGKLADPRASAGQLWPGLPVLLFPLRLETRFGGGEPPTELWVRAYPDDCVVDSFEEELSDGELEDAERYWTDVWTAAGDVVRQRAAWRALVAGHGSGRAAWISARHAPLNPAGAGPKRVAPTDVFLTILQREPLTGSEPVATTAYWTAVWHADGDPDALAAAEAALVTAVGAQRAAELAASTRPANLDEKGVSVSVAFLLLPPRPAAKEASWTRPATAALLPDRLVLLGYAGGTQVVEQLGAPLPPRLVVGPDPSAPAAEQLHDEQGELVVPDELRWLVDFERAVQVGLGFRVTLDDETRGGLDRLLVVGLRLSSDAAETKDELETLLAHHRHGTAGLALVPQGTPTNNTDGAPSGVSRVDDADASFADPLLPVPRFTLTGDPLAKRDGQWLAEWLGIDPAGLVQVPGAESRDQLEARAMQTALWPATLGYVAGTLLQPLLDERAQQAARSFFTRYVSGRGPIPAVRVGSQPYGILVTTAFSRLRRGDRQTRDPGLLDALAERLGIARADWDALTQGVARLRPSAAPFQTLLDVLGLQATSVEYRQRYAESLADLYNRANLAGFGERMVQAYEAEQADAAADELLRRLGAEAGVEPQLMRLFLFSAAQRLHGPLIEDGPLAESGGLREVTTDGRNYVEWLADAARVSLEDVRREQGFAAAAPDALLFLLLRHAVMLGYWDAGVRLHADAGLIDAPIAQTMRREPAFVHVAGEEGPSESRFGVLYRTDARVTGRDDMLVAEYIPTVLGDVSATRLLSEQLDALDVLRAVPTARLERLLAEHIDCCSYRLDAWLGGLAHERLATLRAGDEKGLHVGAFGWLEDVRPKQRAYEPVTPDDERATFAPPGASPLLRDPANGGFMHTPSLNHAVTAAVMRSGYLANATPETPDALAVGLSSRRVRTALDVLDGMRNGQSLGALLGYQLERGLHDSHGLAEVDELVLDLRKAFPLVADRLEKTGPGVAIESIEARNVVDGYALATQVRRIGTRTYPYGASLPPASPAQVAALDAEVERLLDVYDAVSDLVLAESVHQTVLGNHDRAAASLDSASGTLPPEPAVVATPRSGLALTHRLGLQLEAGLDPLHSPLPGLAVTPRAIGQPAINAWLARRLPAPANVVCAVTITDPVSGAEQTVELSQHDLGLQPLDLISVLRTEADQAMNELDDRILRHVLATEAPRPDAELRIRYTQRPADTAKRALFEVAPLVASLRALVLRSRPLRATDVALHGEATKAEDDVVRSDPAAATEVQSRLVAARGALLALAADPRLADPAANRDALVAHVDELLGDAVDELSRAASFGLPQTGFGDLLSWRAQTFRDVLAAAGAAAERLSERLARFEEIMLRVGAAATDDEKMLLLQRAELLVATAPTSPLPGSVAAYEPTVTMRGGTFADRRDDLRSIASTTRTTLSGLLADVAAIPLAGVDAEGLDLAPFGDRIAVLAGTLHDRLVALAGQVDGRLAAAQLALDAHAAATSDRARLAALEQAHVALLGEEARVLGEFPLPAARAAEWTTALQAATGGELLGHLTDRLLPVDDWLHGAARVREKVRQLEQVVLLSEALGRDEPALTPIQLPHVPGEPWLGLEYPPTTILGERLLYTAHYGVPFDGSADQCGLLLDEWTELLPGEHETTGIAFHYDRPSSEPPQSWLLVVPPDPAGAWTFADLVDAVGETLDLARVRAVEPDQLDDLPWARFLPAVVTAATLHPITISVDLNARAGDDG
jgi:hypothetical protein